jgi:ATP-dependent helicase/nuclease subunit B
MTVRFLLGRAGSGKTRLCLNEIAKQSGDAPIGPPLIFLVPEQATFQAEKELVDLCRQGTNRAQVLSFTRMADRLVEPYLLATKPKLSDSGRQIVMRRLLQENESKLKVFSKAASQPCFSQQLAAEIKELKSYAVSPLLLNQAASMSGTVSSLSDKVSDLSLMLEAYNHFAALRFTDTEDLMNLLASQVGKSMALRGAKVWVDGYAGFTGLEYRILAALMQYCDHVEIALCLEPEEAGRTPEQGNRFYPTLDTYKRLLTLIHQNSVRFLPTRRLPAANSTRFAQESGLAHIEQHVVTHTRLSFPKETEQVKLVEAANSRVEVEAVARDILHNVRKKGWRLRDFAVIFRRPEQYLETISAVFNEYEIPYFLDQRKDATHHPLVRLIYHAVSSVAKGLPYDDMIPMLKTDFFPLTRYQVDVLENYCLAHGIRGKRWLDHMPWTWRHESGQSTVLTEEVETQQQMFINTAKDIFRQYFVGFYQRMKEAADVAAYCQAVFELLQQLDVAGTMERWSESARQQGMLETGAHHRRIWQEITDMLDQMWSIMGDCKTTVYDFTLLLQSGLEGLSAGLVPPGLDQVLIGGIERSRQPKLKAVYLPGLCEGDFPARVSEEGLLADHERECLKLAGIEIGTTQRQRLFNEQYLAYIAMTRASDYLYLSYTLADGEGRAKRPSSLFNSLREMFPANQLEVYGAEPEQENVLHYLVSGSNTAAWLVAKAANTDPDDLWQPIIHIAHDSKPMKKYLSQIWSSLEYNNQSNKLSMETVTSMYGKSLYSSVSRLELFARCPFAHFARYGLGLSERKVFKLEAPELGTFCHEALNVFVRGFIDEGRDWQSLNETETTLRMEQIVERLVPTLKGEILLSSARYRLSANNCARYWFLRQ